MAQAKSELFDKELIEQASFFKALSHPARLQIIKLLAETKTCITGDISEELPLGRTTVNQHIKELKNIGLIQGTTEGVKTNYCLNSEVASKIKIALSLFLSEIDSCCTDSTC